MSEKKSKSSSGVSAGIYSRPNLVRFGGVTKLTASGTSPATEGPGANAVRRP